MLIFSSTGLFCWIGIDLSEHCHVGYSGKVLGIGYNCDALWTGVYKVVQHHCHAITMVVLQVAMDTVAMHVLTIFIHPVLASGADWTGRV